MVERVFKAIDRYGNETEFELVEPGISENHESDMQYKAAYSKALQAGIMPRDRMIDEMRKHGVWNDSYFEELSELSKKIAILEYEFNKLVDSKDRTDIDKKAIELAKSRSRAWELISIQQSPLANSCDGISELIRQEALLASCVRLKVNNQRYWKNYALYVQERDSDTKSTVVSEAMGIQTSFLEEKRNSILLNCPEQKWLEREKKALKEKATEEVKKSKKVK